MESFRLKVFRSVAKHLSFTKASNELFISQPAITKNIQSLEKELGIRLFERFGNKINLTSAGIILAEYANKSFVLQLDLENRLNFFREDKSGLIRIGASTTIAQYVIASALSKYHKKFPDVKISLISGNSERIANALIKGEIDLGIVEGKVKDHDIHYSKFTTDELVAVTGVNNRAIKDEIDLNELVKTAIILRERGSGTLEVFEHAIKNKNIKLSSLNIIMYLGSTEAIKQYLESDNCIGFLSTKAIEKEINKGVLRIVKIKGLQITRTFEFIKLQGSGYSELTKQFIRIARMQITKSN